MHDAHRQRDLLAFRASRVSVSVPAFVGEPERFPDGGPEIEPLDQHVAHFAAGREVVDRPGVRAFLERPRDLLRAPPGHGRRWRTQPWCARRPPDLRRPSRASGRGGRCRPRRPRTPRGHGRCSRHTAAARPSRRSRRTSSSRPASRHRAPARRQDRSCDSKGWPNALSCPSASVATSSPEPERLIGNGEPSRCRGGTRP